MYHTDATEPEEVEVEDLPDRMAPPQIGSSGPPKPRLPAPRLRRSPGSPGTCRLTRRSRMPSRTFPGALPSHTQTLTTADVVDIGALFGGIAGLNHLFVRVRASSD